MRGRVKISSGVAGKKIVDAIIARRRLALSRRTEAIAKHAKRTASEAKRFSGGDGEISGGYRQTLIALLANQC